MLERAWGKGGLLHSWGECKLVQPLWRTVWRTLKKLKTVTAWSRSPLLDLYLDKRKAVWGGTHMPAFTAALLIGAVTRTLGATWMSVNRWMGKEDAACVMLLSPKGDEIPFAVKWRGREVTIPSEVNQRKTVSTDHLHVESKKMVQVNLFTK